MDDYVNTYLMLFQSSLKDTIDEMLLPSTKEFMTIIGINNCKHYIDRHPLKNNKHIILTILPGACHCNHCNTMMPNSFDDSFYFLADPSGAPYKNLDETPYIVCFDCINLHDLRSRMYFRPKYLVNTINIENHQSFLKGMIVRMVLRKYLVRWLTPRRIIKEAIRKQQFLSMVSMLRNKLILEP